MNSSSHSLPARDGGRSVLKNGRSRLDWRKLLVLAVIAAVGGWLYFRYRQDLTLDALAAREAALTEFGRTHPAWLVAAAFLAYVLVTGLSLPGAAAMTLVIAWTLKSVFGPTYGFAAAVLLVSFASTTGATCAFFLSRYLFRDFVQRRFGERLERFHEALRREGAFYLFTLRLVPAVPFFVINVVMGLTPIRAATFWWVSQLGMLPGTCVYVYAGWTVPSLKQLAKQGAGGVLTPNVIIAFVLLGTFPWIVKAFMKRFRNSKDVDSPEQNTDDQSQQSDA